MQKRLPAHIPVGDWVAVFFALTGMALSRRHIPKLEVQFTARFSPADFYADFVRCVPKPEELIDRHAPKNQADTLRRKIPLAISAIPRKVVAKFEVGPLLIWLTENGLIGAGFSPVIFFS